MKNKRIRFDDRFYWTTLNIALLVLLLFFLLLMINNNAPLGFCVFLSIIFSLFLCGLYVFPKMGLYFNYRLGIIKYLGPHKIKKRLIKMCEIEKIEFIEICVPKGSGLTPKHYVALADKVATIYRNGKIFKFIIYLKNNDIIEIPYYNLFKARSKKRVLKQEEKISNIVKEFNLLCISK
jgi:hypothetical protein